MPLVATRGAASAQGFGEFAVAATPTYIEDVYSTYLYTGNGSTQTITNGIDLSTKGGLVWQKDRSQGTGYHHILQDTARGATNCLFTNLTNAQSQDSAGTGFVFNNNGFTIGSTNVKVNASGDNYVSWTFRKAPKFFDVVTYTGNGTAGRTVAHSLGSVPGCMIVRPTSAVDDWFVYHRSLLNSQSLFLNLTTAASNTPSAWNSTTPTSTEFTVGTNTATNANGVSYVAYLFAHDAGGFGLTGTDNVISCGSYVVSGGSATINLGYEPQFVLTKASSATGNWLLLDNMRQFDTGGATFLSANTTAAETGYSVSRKLTNTGFTLSGASDGTYIYIAIRRGPMKVPTSGTSVFTPIARTGTGSNATVSGVGFPPDLFIGQIRGTAGYWNGAVDRLRGVTKRLVTSQTNAEDTTTDAVTSFTMDGSTLGIDSNGFVNESGKTYIEWNFRRAPSFFDEVCYTGNGAAMTVPHNLGVAPELIILKSRNNAEGWMVYAAPLGNNKVLYLNSTFEADNAGLRWNDTTPTSSVFSVGKFSGTTPWSSGAGYTYVAYLFATCAGVSKVGSVTHSEPTTVSCGFTPRFVLIKSTQDTGTNDWFVFDSARGITSGNDPYLRLNSTGAENTPFGAADLIDPTADGFIMNGFNGGNYIYLAIA